MVCSLIFINSFFKIMYHTNQTNIQILPKLKFLQIFRFSGYNRSMAILNNLDNEYPLFESESSSGGMQIAKDICSNGCNCKTSSDHNFVMEEIDFEQ